MTRPRPVPFRTLAVHAPPQAARPRAAAATRGGFDLLLRPRRATPPAAAGADEAAEDEPLPVPAAHPGGREHDDRSDDGGGDEAPGPASDDGDWARALAPSTESMGALLADVARRAGERRPAPPSAIRAVADTIAGFCNEPAVSDSEGWNVRIVLREDVLPGTTLELGVSPHWLRVRFLVGDARARRLLYEHGETLRGLLAAAQKRPREIAIDVE